MENKNTKQTEVKRLIDLLSEDEVQLTYNNELVDELYKAFMKCGYQMADNLEERNKVRLQIIEEEEIIKMMKGYKGFLKRNDIN
jgi:hypothetical protein